MATMPFPSDTTTGKEREGEGKEGGGEWEGGGGGVGGRPTKAIPIHHA